MNRKKLAIWVSSIMMVTLLAGCSRSGGNSQTETQTESTTQTDATERSVKEGDKIRVVGCVLSMDHTFQQQLALGWQIPQTWEGESVDIELAVVDSQGDVEKELQATETYIDKGIDAWVGYPLNADALEAISKEMTDAGIIVII